MNQVSLLRQEKWRVFVFRYPSPFYAWIERQDAPVRRYWASVMDPHILPELKVLMAPAHRPTESQELWDCWYRAAVTVLVHPIRGRMPGDFTEQELAKAFGIAPGRYRNLIIEERAWRPAPEVTKPVRVGHIVANRTNNDDLGDWAVYVEQLKPATRGLIAGQPGIEALASRLFK